MALQQPNGAKIQRTRQAHRDPARRSRRSRRVELRAWTVGNVPPARVLTALLLSVVMLLTLLSEQAAPPRALGLR